MEGNFTPLRGSYGRACSNCSRAKYKCAGRGDGISCERCHRLGKDCQPSASVRKRNVDKGSGSKASRLEEKVDDLVSLLRPQAVENQSQSTGSGTLSQFASPDLDHLLSPASSSAPPADIVIDTTTGFARFATPTPTPSSINGVTVSPLASYVSLYDIPDATAEEQLETFRQVFLPLFAFVHIPNSTSASNLRQQKPFLWLVIMSLTTKSAGQQIIMGDTVRRIVSQQALAEQEKSMDLLLGILCYIAWCHYHKKDKSPQAMWSQLAAALATELEIHCPPQGDLTHKSPKAIWFPAHYEVPKVRTMEERRALLGTYLVTSMVWIALRKMEPLRWTSYMDDCVRVLTEQPDSDLDIILATQAKCYVIMNQMTPNPAEFTNEGEAAKGQPHYIVKVMQLQVQGIRNSLPVDLQTNRSILLFLYAAEISVKEALFNRPKIHDQTGLSNLQRLEGLESILTAIEKWLEVMYEVPPSDWIGITFSVFIQFGHCLMLLFKLGSIDEPGWDTSELTRRANLLDIVEFFAQRLDDIPKLLGMVDAASAGDSGLFFKSPKLLRGIKALFASKMQADGQLPRTSDNAGSDGGFSLPDDIAMELAEDPWIPDLFSSWWEL